MVDEFEAIQIETLHGCNLNCKTCPNSVMEKHNELMDKKIYFKIMDDLKMGNYRGRISPYLMNEPTLDDRLEYFIRETRAMFPNNEIMISSNGVKYGIDYYEKLFKAGLDRVTFTAYTEHLYNKFKEYEDKIRIKIVKVFDKNLDDVFCNRGGNIKVGPDIIVKKTCSKGVIQSAINYKGDMVLCCADYYDTVVAGNVMDNDVIDLFNCEKFREHREKLKVGDRASIELCRNCNFLR